MGIIFYLAHFAVLCSLFPFFILFTRKNKRIHIVLKLYVVEIVISNLINSILFYLTNFNQDYFFWSNLFIETLLISLLFLIFFNNKFFKKILVVFIVLCVLTFIYSFQLDLMNRFTFYGTYSRITLSILSIFIIIERYFNSEFDSLFDDFIFNYSSAVLLYSGLQFYVMIFNDLIIEKLDSLFLFTWPIIQISSVLYYLILSRAIWKLKN